MMINEYICLCHNRASIRVLNRQTTKSQYGIAMDCRSRVSEGESEEIDRAKRNKEHEPSIG
jgi:hypothetical protein